MSRATAGATKSKGADAIADFLEAAGWVAAAIGVLAGLLIAMAMGSDYSASSNPAYGLLVGAIGLVQGLVLVGFGRGVGYLASIAASTERAAKLIDESLNG